MVKSKKKKKEDRPKDRVRKKKWARRGRRMLGNKGCRWKKWMEEETLIYMSMGYVWVEEDAGKWK